MSSLEICVSKLVKHFDYVLNNLNDLILNTKELYYDCAITVCGVCVCVWQHNKFQCFSEFPFGGVLLYYLNSVCLLSCSERKVKKKKLCLNTCYFLDGHKDPQRVFSD